MVRLNMGEKKRNILTCSVPLYIYLILILLFDVNHFNSDDTVTVKMWFQLSTRLFPPFLCVLTMLN